MYPNDPNDPRRRDSRGEYWDDNRTRAYSSDPYAADPQRDAYAQDRYTQDPYADPGYAQQQYPAQSYAEPARKPRAPKRGPQINIGLFIGGVVATAVVTALAAWLVAWIIRVISQRITETGKFGVWNPVAQDEYWFAVVGGLCALFAGALWYVLQMTTPSPDQFYAWIVGLLVIAAVLLPLLLSREISAGIGTAIMHLVIGLPILFLIRAMGSRSVEYR
ncbi:DUF6069 family protein [Williamsia deligens]|uniref:DUF6069 family protein n=1 Tax=Williamsia deligens TaxID=321325 RepID=A0ABW3GEV1_9NOCA|nr:DUF6069 family protein [Williamsia deligens]MCP2196197.1 hypothetical protein [Williamsia deligens]